MTVWARPLLLSIALLFLAPPAVVSAAAQGDGLFIYGEGAVTTPRYRNWTEMTTTIGGELTGIAAAATIRHTAIEPSPIRNEFIAGAQTTGGVLYIQRWNGTTWSNEWNVTVGDGNLPRFDIAYEAVSGQAVVMYTSNAASPNELRYRVWDGTSWTGPTNYDPIRTTGIVDTVKLVRQPTTDNIGVAWGDRNFDLSANVWNGATNSLTGEPAAALSTGLSKVGTSTTLTNWSFDLAFESVSGDLMVAWGNDAVLDLYHVIRTAAGVWGSATATTAFAEEPTDMELSAEPASDYIAYVNATDNGGDAESAIWSGSAWAPLSNFDATIDTVAAGTKNIAVTWLVKGANSRAVVTYDDNNAAGVDWLFYNKNTNTWAGTQTDFTAAPSPAGVNDFVHRLLTNPYQPNSAILTLIDSSGDLTAKRVSFDGANISWASEEPGGVVLEATISSTTGFSADYGYFRYAPGILGTDILDDNDVTIASPSVAFPALTVGFACQVPTATLGTSAQKIRINNGTANNLWSVSIAATAGVSATWSGGVTGYDFNDPSGSPSGCADGPGDADGVGGQLSIDPSTSAISSMLDCTTTGVSKGSASAFSQGVIDSITLASTSASAQPSCFFDVTGIGLSQTVPSDTGGGAYALNLTVTVVAN